MPRGGRRGLGVGVPAEGRPVAAQEARPAVYVHPLPAPAQHRRGDGEGQRQGRYGFPDCPPSCRHRPFPAAFGQGRGPFQRVPAWGRCVLGDVGQCCCPPGAAETEKGHGDDAAGHQCVGVRVVQARALGAVHFSFNFLRPSACWCRAGRAR